MPGLVVADAIVDVRGGCVTWSESTGSKDTGVAERALKRLDDNYRLLRLEAESRV